MKYRVKIVEILDDERSHRIFFQAGCTCGWCGPIRDCFTDSSLDRFEHKSSHS